MPRIHDPFSPNTVGPGSAVGNRSIARRSRRRKTVTTPKATTTEAGGNFDFCSQESRHTAQRNTVSETRRTIQVAAPSIPAGDKTIERGTTIVRMNQPMLTKDAPSSSGPSKTLPLKHRHALAVDTRYLDMTEGERIAKLALKECLSFLTSLVERGLSPLILASTELQTPVSTKKTARPKRLVMGIRSCRLTKDVICQIESGDVDKILSLVPIRPAVNSGNTKNQKAVHVPKALLAHSSWKLFSDIVQSILQEDAKQNSKGDGLLDITILTNDISFLSDTKEDSHKRALDAFWDRLKPHFQTAKIRKLHIVLASTGAQVLTIGGGDEDHDKEVEKDDLFPTKSKTAHSSAADDEANPPPDIGAMARKRGIEVAQCLCAIQDQIEKRAQAYFQENRSAVQFGQSIFQPVDLAFWKIDSSSVGFKTLLRTWSRDILPGGRILFDLPETLDGTQCSVSLDVTYKTCPFRFDSTLARGLSRDMELLSKSKLKVLQLVPISTIDASLLWGVNIFARSGLESDIERTHEMRMVLGSLLKILSQKDCALLLRCEGPSCDTDECLFHQNGQLLLLMVEEPPASLNKAKISPTSCVLLRYSCADHMLVETGTTDVASETDEDQFAEIVENSLECLDCTTLNPFYLEAMRPRPPDTSGFNRQVLEPGWTDDAGVGSRVEALPGFSASSSADPNTVLEKHGTKDKDIWTDTVGVGSRATNTSDVSDIETTPVLRKMKKKKEKGGTGLSKAKLVGSGKGQKAVTANFFENDSSSGGFSSPSSDSSGDENDP